MKPRCQQEHDASEAAARPREQGLALLAVLWIIASGALMVATFNVNVRSGLAFVRSEVQLSQADALLDAGLEIAATRLIDEDTSRQWLPDGRWHSIAFAGSTIRIRIQDPNGLIDLNKADEKLLLDFFKYFASNASEAKLITDRIIVARGQTPGGEGAAQERGRVTKPSAMVAPFMDVGQLRQIEGMSMDLFRKIAPLMTVFSRDGSVNPLTAPEAVFKASSQTRAAGDRARRDAFKAGRRANGASSAEDDDVDADDFGPAYSITVEAAGADNAYRNGKTYVIVMGLDQEFPYRILSVRPMADQR